jgi:DNA-binding HxlR family transcriptional regulator
MSAVLLPTDLRALVMGNPVARAFALIGDAWTLLILREAFYGVRRFSLWRERLAIPPTVLTDRLQRLTSAGVFTQDPVSRDYRLSAMGRDLYGIAILQGQWERDYARSSYQERYALQFFDRGSGASIRPGVLNREHGSAIDRRRVHFAAGPGLTPIAPPTTRRRRSRNPTTSRPVLERSVEIMGDYWSLALISAQFFRVRRFDEFGPATGIASNILADRLPRLVEARILDRVVYQHAPIRFEYRLAEAGRGLFPLIMAIHGWSERWLCPADASPLTLFDGATGERITPVVCDLNSGRALDPRQVRWEMARLSAKRA